MGERGTGNGDATGRSGPSTRQATALVLAVLALVFVLQNRGETTLAFFGVSFAAPLWLYTLIALLVGALIGALLTRRSRRSG